MSNSSVVHIGVDISKAHLDCDLLGRALRLPNSMQGFKMLLPLLPSNAHLCIEATGGYERPLVDTLHRSQVRCSVLNPRQVRDFARAKGTLAKTDAIDARVLSDYGRAMDPKPSTPPEPAQRQLAELNTLRDQFVAIQTQIINAGEHLTDPVAKRILKSQLLHLRKQIKKVEKACLDTLKSNPPLAKQDATLQAIQGIGAVTSITLIALLPELGSASRGQIAALAGLAPLNDDSGPRKGLRHIRGGRSRVRRALYMAALSAIRSKGALSSFYHRLRSAGKPPKVALIASARKLLLFINYQLKSNPV
jgi:transposase